MKRSALFTGLVLIALSVAIAHWARPSRDWTTASAQAAKLLAEGETDLRAFRWQQAERTLAAAVEADPGFAMARAAHAEALATLGESERSRRAAQQADSLAQLLRDSAERLAIQLRLTAYYPPLAASRDSLLDLLEGQRPDCLIVAITRARQAEQRRDAAAEAAAWHDALRIDPNFAGAWNQLGYLAARQGRYEDAEGYLSKYAFLAPDLANPHDSLGEILAQQGKYERAELEFKTSLSLQPDFFPSLLTLAQVYVERGQIERGVQLLEKVRAQIAGTDWERRVDGTLMRTYYDHELRDALSKAVARWLAAHPQDWQAAYYRAVALGLAGQPAQASAACDTFAASLPRAPWFDGTEATRDRAMVLVHNCRGMLALEAGVADSACAHFAAALKASSDAAPSETWSLRLNHAKSLLLAGDPASALAQARAVLDVNPRRLRALSLETRALLALDRRDEAREALARLREALAAADVSVVEAFENASYVRELSATRPAP